MLHLNKIHMKNKATNGLKRQGMEKTNHANTIFFKKWKQLF